MRDEVIDRSFPPQNEFFNRMLGEEFLTLRQLSPAFMGFFDERAMAVGRFTVRLFFSCGCTGYLYYALRVAGGERGERPVGASVEYFMPGSLCPYVFEPPKERDNPMFTIKVPFTHIAGRQAIDAWERAHG